MPRAAGILVPAGRPPEAKGLVCLCSLSCPSVCQKVGTWEPLSLFSLENEFQKDQTKLFSEPW